MNVLLITLDACRFDHLSMSGYKRDTSPNLAKLSKEMNLFTNTYAVVSQSDPAIVSILTGSYPHTHGVRDVGNKKTVSQKMLQEILKENGYKTACMSIEQQDNDSIRKGFDEFNEISWRIKSKIKRTVQKAIKWDKEEGSAEVVTDQAMNWIKKNKENKFFLYLHYMELHWPYEPPAPYDNMYDKEYKGNHHFNDLNEGKIKRGENVFENNLSEEERNHAIAHYDGAINYMDLHVNRLCEFLKKENLWEDTIIVMVGDHGEHLGEQNIYYHHVASIYQPSIRVPLIIKTKTNGVESDSLTETIDILPTVLSELSMDIPKEVKGKSLTPLTDQTYTKVKDYVFAESGIAFLEQNKRKFIEGVEGKWRMVSDGKHKLILIPHPENNIYELYDLQNDPEEKSNLIDQETETAEKLKTVLQNWMDKKSTDSDKQEVFSEKEEAKVKDRLRRLGYLD